MPDYNSVRWISSSILKKKNPSDAFMNEMAKLAGAIEQHVSFSTWMFLIEIYAHFIKLSINFKLCVDVEWCPQQNSLDTNVKRWYSSDWRFKKSQIDLRVLPTILHIL